MNRISWRAMLIVTMAFALFFIWNHSKCIVLADSVFKAESKDEDAGHLIVSMVYDDSGSMEGEKGMYCNYTFQLFLSLFGDNDELFITYMSKPRTSSNYSINNNRQARVDNLRAHKNKIFTPITAVKTAYERLLNEDGGVNDIYWLIVLTDGNFYDEQNNELRQEQLNQYIGSYAKTPMSNGSYINILYVGIGDDFNLPEVEEDNVHVMSTSQPEDILPVLDSCGDFFTECIKAENLACIEYTVEKNTLHLESKLPLSKVIVIQNNINEEEHTAVGTDLRGGELTQTERIDIHHSYMDYDKGIKGSLKGQVTYWEKKDDFIQKGIDITFDSNLGEEEVVVYVQPALKLNINYYNEANELVELNDCTLKDVLKAKLVIKRLDTEEEVELSIISEKYSGSINVMDKINKMCLAEAQDIFLSDISMVNEGMVVTGSLNFSDAYTYRKIEPISLYRSKLSSETGYQFDRTGLTGNTQGIVVSVTKNEVPFERKDMAALSVYYDTSKFPPLFQLIRKINSDGTMELIPQFGYDNLYGKLFVNWLCVWLISPKNMNIAVKFVNITNVVTLTDVITIQMKHGNTLLELWYLLYPFLVIFLIIGFIVKKRFKVRQRIYYINLDEKDGQLVASWRNWHHVTLDVTKIRDTSLRMNPFCLVPYASNRKRCGDIIIYASVPFYYRKNSVCLYLHGWNYFKLTEYRTVSYQDVALEIDKNAMKENRMVTLNAGEYIYIQKEDQHYLYHFGKGR